MIQNIKIDSDLKDVLDSVYRGVKTKEINSRYQQYTPVDGVNVEEYTGDNALKSFLHDPKKHDKGKLAGDLYALNIAQATWTSEDVQTYDPHKTAHLRQLVKQVVKVGGRGTVVPTAQHLMKAPKCVMGWHTNVSGPGKRVYMVHAEKSNKSYFKYFCNKTKKSVICKDQKGWQVRMFDISEKQPLWHCVYSECDRISLGFRIIYNL